MLGAADVVYRQSSGAPTFYAPEGTLYWDNTGHQLHVNNNGLTGWTALASGGVTGSGANGQVTYWTGFSSLSSSFNFLYDAGTGKLTVISTAGSQLRLQYDASNHVELLAGSTGRLTVTPTGTAGDRVTVACNKNAEVSVVVDNASVGASASTVLSIATAGAGDVAYKLTSTSITYSIGYDNSDASFVVSKSATLGTANRWRFTDSAQSWYTDNNGSGTFSFENSNAGSAAAARLNLIAPATSTTGDIWINYDRAAGASWSQGADSSDGYAFILAQSAALGTTNRWRAVTGEHTFYVDSAASGYIYFRNPNAGASANIYLRALIPASSSGDVTYTAEEEGSNSYAWGFDQSASAFVLAQSTVLGTQNLYQANLTAQNWYGSVAGTSPYKFENSSSNAAAAVQQSLTVPATSTTGDVWTSFVITATTTWSLGIDNSNSDAFTVSSSAALGTNDRFTILTSGNVGIGTTTPDSKLEIVSTTSLLRLTHTDTTEYGDWTLNILAGGNFLQWVPASAAGPYAGLGIQKSSNNNTVEIYTENTSNTSGSDALLVAYVAGTSAGDPSLKFRIPGGVSWSLGADNSDADAFVVSEGTVLGTTNRMRIASGGAVDFYADLTTTANLRWKSGTANTGTLDHAITADRTWTFPDLTADVALMLQGSGAPGSTAPEGTFYWDTAGDTLYVNKAGTSSWTGVGAGSVTGTGVANQVTFWSGTSAVTGDAEFTVVSDAGGVELTILNDGNQLVLKYDGTDNATHIVSPNLYTITGNSLATMSHEMSNTGALSTHSFRNIAVGASSKTRVLIESGATSDGDVYLQTRVNGGSDWVYGYDVSDASYVLSQSDTLGTTNRWRVNASTQSWYGDTTGSAIYTFTNVNTATNVYTSVNLTVPATSTTGDPFITYTVTTGTSWSHGLDNSDSDAFVLSESTGLGTSNRMRVATGGAVDFYADVTTSANLKWKSGTSFTGTLDHAISADRTWTFPNLTADVALMLQGSGAPGSSAPEGTFYWNTTGNTLYVNNDGATSWTSVSGGGGITGSGTNGEIAYWTSATNISSEAGLAYNASDNTLIVTGAAGSPQLMLKYDVTYYTTVAVASTGEFHYQYNTTPLVRFSWGLAGTNVVQSFNTATGILVGDASFEARTDCSGDAYFKVSLAASSYVFGFDNTDAAFVLSSGATLGTTNRWRVTDSTQNWYGTLVGDVVNKWSNVSTDADAGIRNAIEVPNTSTTGDVWHTVGIASGATWAFGLDNSSGDSFTLSQSATLGSSNRWEVTASTQYFTCGTAGLVGYHFENSTSDASSATQLAITIIGTSTTGDPSLVFNIKTVALWAMGIDNSDSDSFVLGESNVLGSLTRMRLTASTQNWYGTLVGDVVNKWENVSTDADAGIRNYLEVPATSTTGDVWYSVAIASGVTWSWGIDNSDSDAFVLAGSATLGSTNRFRLTSVDEYHYADFSAVITFNFQNVNTGTGAASQIKAIVPNTATTGDPFVTFEITGSTAWSTGLDNSDSDAYVISQATTLGTSNRMRIATAGDTDFYANVTTTQNLRWMSGTSFVGTLDHVITADRTWTFPDAAGTVAFGTGTATHVAFWSGTNTVTGDAGLTYVAGTDTLTSGSLVLASAGTLTWSTDLVLSRVSAGIGKVTNGANACSWRVHGDATNYVNLLHDSINGYIQTTTGALVLNPTTNVVWTGSLLPNSDNAQDICSVGARARTIYAGTSIGIGTASTPAMPLEVLTTASAQVRLTYTAASVYADFTLGSGGTLILAPTNNIVSIGTPLSSQKGFHSVLANVGGGVSIQARNTDNTNAASFASCVITVGGSTAQDPYTYLAVTGVTEWSYGIDNSDSDAFVFSAAGGLGASNRFRISTVGETTLYGNTIFGVDNTYDLGASGATRPRTIYPGTSIVFPTTGILSWSTDLHLRRGAAGRVDQYDGATAQEYRLFNVGGANAEYCRWVWDSNYVHLLNAADGAGAARGMILGTAGNADVRLRTGAVDRWMWSGSGHYVAYAHNTYDVGSGAADPRTIYAGTSVVIGATTHTITATGVVFNETGIDQDFRIEGDTNVNLFFVDASTDSIGIGTSSPDAKLEIVSTTSLLRFTHTDTTEYGNWSMIVYGATGNALAWTPVSAAGPYGALGIAKAASGSLVELYADNTSNTAASHAVVGSYVAGTSAGDPHFRYYIAGGTSWATGADNSDSDAFVLAASTDLGTDNRLRIATGGEITSYGNVIFGTDATYNIGAVGATRPNNLYLAADIFWASGTSFEGQFAHAITAARIWTFPDLAGTVVVNSASQTIDNNARVTVRKNSGADVGARRRMNFIEGTDISLTIADDAGSEEVDVTVTSTAVSAASDNAFIMAAGCI